MTVPKPSLVWAVPKSIVKVPVDLADQQRRSFLEVVGWKVIEIAESNETRPADMPPDTIAAAP